MRENQVGPNRRSFLRNAGLAGVGATALGALGVAPAQADTANTANRGTGRWNPDGESLQFTVAVMPDTQYLYWGSQNSINPEPQEASLRYVIENSGKPDNNVVFLAHLGDLTQDADVTSFQAVDKTFKAADSAGVAYSVLAGNHD